MDNETQEPRSRELELLVKLSRTAEFQLWRDLVAKPIVQQLEADLANPLDLTEANLKAKVMHLNTVKGLFYHLFDQAKAQIDIERETEV